MRTGVNYSVSAYNHSSTCVLLSLASGPDKTKY
jgi:hypothetical protein